MKPFSPQDIIDQQGRNIPNFVIEAVNDMLVKKLSGNSVILRQGDVMNAVLEAADRAGTPTDRGTVFDNRWLDFENHYRQNGWDVRYDKPHYTESYEAYWEFKVK